MKYFCFRFDVDTHRCLTKGVPNLMTLAQSLDVRFTFFVNMGRAVSRKQYLKKSFQRKQVQQSQITKLSNMQKLGVADYMITSLFNPEVGKRHLGLIKQLHQNGHEVGLHGGKNHALWQNFGKSWSEEQIQQEVEWGLQSMRQAEVKSPFGFASPGWQGSTQLNVVLQRLGFAYVADVYGNDCEEIIKANSDLSLPQLPTNIVGEPGGVGYIEYLRAKGMDDAQIIQDFTRRLETKNELAVVYDHPYYVGVQELSMVREMIAVAKFMDFEVTTLAQIVQELNL